MRDDLRKKGGGGREADEENLETKATRQTGGVSQIYSVLAKTGGLACN